MQHHRSNSAPPWVSIIIPCYHSHATLAACLESLCAQTYKDFEVILVDSTPGDDRSDRMASLYTFVRCLRSPQRLGAHAARNKGTELARGSLFVFTDPDMRAHPAWLGHLVECHGGHRRLVGGGVKALPGYWNHAVHMTKYGWWLDGGRLQKRPQLPSGNLSVAREAFERAGGFPAKFWAGDSELSWRLRAMGYDLWLEPAAVLTHLHEATIQDFLAERFARGRDFGLARIQREQWRRLRCAVQLAFLPAIPSLMALKTGWFAGRCNHLPWWLVTLPVQAAGYAAWGLGEATAHWQGLRTNHGAHLRSWLRRTTARRP